MNDVINMVLSGDKEAFALIVREFGLGVRAYLAAHVNDPHVVDDLAQETFMAAYANLKNHRREHDLEAWIKSIGRNQMLMHFRQAGRDRDRLQAFREHIIAELSEEVARATANDSAKTVERLSNCIRRLPERIRTVIEARYYDHQGVTALAQRLKSSVTAISSLLYRGRQELRACMEKEVEL